MCEMEKYNVHVYAVVRVKLEGIEAAAMPAAIDKATEGIDLRRHFRGTNPETEWAEEYEGFLVDVVGDTEYEQSKFFGSDGKEVDQKVEGRVRDWTLTADPEGDEDLKVTVRLPVIGVPVKVADTAQNEDGSLSITFTVDLDKIVDNLSAKAGIRDAQ